MRLETLRRKTLRTQCATAIVTATLLAFGCGGGEEAIDTGETGDSPAPAETASAPAEETADATAESTETQEAAETAEEEESPRDEEPALTATTIDSSEPIRADKLRDAILPHFGTPVVLEAYLWAPEDDENSLSFYQPLAAKPGQTEEDAKLLELCSTSFGEEVGRDEPLYVRGSLPQRGYSYGEDKTVRLEDCEVLSAGDPPADADVMPLAELHDRTLAWIGKEVTVEGYLKGSSVSQVSSGTISVVELAGSNEPGFGDIAVDCELPTDESIPAAAEENRDETVVRGTVTAENGFYSELNLKDCTFVDS